MPLKHTKGGVPGTVIYLFLKKIRDDDKLLVFTGDLCCKKISVMGRKGIKNTLRNLRNAKKRVAPVPIPGLPGQTLGTFSSFERSTGWWHTAVGQVRPSTIMGEVATVFLFILFVFVLHVQFMV
jgi:hypothetical protein